MARARSRSPRNTQSNLLVSEQKVVFIGHCGGRNVSQNKGRLGGFKDSVTTATNGVFLVVFWPSLKGFLVSFMFQNITSLGFRFGRGLLRPNTCCHGNLFVPTRGISHLLSSHSWRIYHYKHVWNNLDQSPPPTRVESEGLYGFF